MIGFGILWIGVVVHLFMMVITVQSIIGKLPRLFLIIPGSFYAAGLAVGLYSNIPVLRWQSQQQWFQIDKQIPMDTHDLAFFDRDDAIWFKYGGALQPERFGFKLIDRGSDHPSPYLVIGGGSCADSSVIRFSSGRTVEAASPSASTSAAMMRRPSEPCPARIFERVPIFCFRQRAVGWSIAPRAGSAPGS